MNRVRIALVNIGLLVAGIVLAELIYGGWLGNRPLEQLAIPVGVDIDYEVNAADGSHWRSNYRRDRNGLRGNFSDPSEIAVLSIGGSTTDQRLLSHDQSWQGVMERTLALKGRPSVIANAGIDGQSTVGHLRAIDDWLKTIPGLRPKWVMAYIGINDMAVAAAGVADAMRPPDSLYRFVTDRSALYRLWRTVAGVFRAEFYRLRHDPGSMPAGTWAPAGIPDVPNEDLAAYGERVTRLVGKLREWGAVPILVTQPHRDLAVRNGVLWTRGGPAGLHSYNRRTMEVCRELGAVCLDLGGELEFVDSDFYDHVHYTPEGAARIGRWLADRLETIFAGK